MKRIILATTLLIASAGAVELGIFGGGNYEKWDSSLPSLLDPGGIDPVNYKGFSFHAGGMASIGFTKPSAPVFIGLETGLRFSQVYYHAKVDSVAVIYKGRMIFVPRIPATYNYFNLAAPLLFKITVPERDWFEWEVSLGPVVIWTPQHTVELHEAYGQDLIVPQETDLGVEARAGVAFKVWKNLWIGPSFSIVYNSTPDKPQTQAGDTEQFMYLSLRASYKL